MHYSPLSCGRGLLCDALLVPSAGQGDHLLLSAGQQSSHAVNMRLTNTISAGLCVVIYLCRPCNTLVLSTVIFMTILACMVTLQMLVLAIQWNPYKEDTLRNEKRVLIIGVVLISGGSLHQ